jgi:long-chain acyl-CoA synthetase
MARMPNSMSGIGFGMTETNGTGTAASGDLFRAQPRSSGVISPLVELQIVDEAGNSLPYGESGEICLRGASMMQGYWNDPEATRATIRDGWLYTGDIGYLDAQGYLFVIDRIKDVINRFGEKIAAAEVESCLLDLAGVEETAVFALPDDTSGEAVCAAIVLRAGVKLDVADVQSHVASRLAAYKVPTRVYIRADPLPRNPAGKLLKRSLREEYLQA